MVGDSADHCYVECGTSQSSVALNTSDAVPTPICGTDSPDVGCAFRPGIDEVRVLVDYGDFDIDEGVTLPGYSVALTSSGVLLGEKHSFSNARLDRDGHAYAVASLSIPPTTRGEFDVSANVTDAYAGVAGPFSVARSKIELRWRDCGESETSSCVDTRCELPAGVGTAAVMVRAPRGGGPDAKVTLTSVVGGEVQPDAPSFPVPQSLPNVWFPVAVPVPDRAEKSWTLSAVSGDVVGQSCAAVALVSRPSVVLGGVPDGAETPVACSVIPARRFPRRILTEPDPACRRIKLFACIAADEGSASVAETLVGRRLRVEATAGVFDDGGASVTKALGVLKDSNDAFLTTIFDVTGVTVPDDLLRVSVTDVGGGSGAALDGLDFGRPFEPLRPVAAALYPPADPIVVGAMGTPEVVVTGRLIAPRVKAQLDKPRFTPSSTATIVVNAYALTAPRAASAPCGTPIPAASIACDPELIERATPGGCAWTTATATPDADGRFTITLPAGQCFLGSLQILVHSPTYSGLGESPIGLGESCLGERPLQEPVKGHPLASTWIHFRAATPADPGQAGASGSGSTGGGG